MSAKHKAIVEEVNEAMRRNDAEGLLARCTEDFEWTMVGEAPIVGKPAVREFLKQGPGEPPQFTVDTLVGDGDVVIAKGDMTMKDQTGTDVRYAYCDVWRFRGEQLASLTAFVIKLTPAAKATAAGASGR